MSIHVQIVEGPLPGTARPIPGWPPAGAGAVVCFDGIVRPSEEGKPLAGLEYEAYQPMAQEMIRRIAAELADRFGLTAIIVEHSTGRVGVGKCSFRLRIASPHRKEALAAADEFIDRLKQDVPIWKSPLWAEGSAGTRQA